MTHDPITSKQQRFIATLASERELSDDMAASVRIAQGGSMTRGEATATIDALKAIPRGGERETREVRVADPGVYRHDGQVYVVKLTRDKQRLYASRVVEIKAQRATEAEEWGIVVGGDEHTVDVQHEDDGRVVSYDARLYDDPEIGDRVTARRVKVEFEYDRGAIFAIEPTGRVSLDEGKAFTIRYGRCIACGRFLKAAESVERGIGPVCRRYFALAESGQTIADLNRPDDWRTLAEVDSFTITPAGVEKIKRVTGIAMTPPRNELDIIADECAEEAREIREAGRRVS